MQQLSRLVLALMLITTVIACNSEPKSISIKDLAELTVYISLDNEEGIKKLSQKYSVSPNQLMKMYSKQVQSIKKKPKEYKKFRNELTNLVKKRWNINPK